MEYVKHKRGKISICNICRQKKQLSWDHIPPKGGIEISAVEMETLLQAFAGGKEHRNMTLSQNGVKYRTICSNCNNLLGRCYDPVLNKFANEVGCYLKTKIHLPEVIHHKTKPLRLMKAIVGHLVAAKANIENTQFDKQAREFVLDENARLPKTVNIFYWPYPYNTSMVIRDFAMFVPRGTFDKPAVFQAMKFFPVAYLVCEKPTYASLYKLTEFSEAGLDEEVEIPIMLSRLEHPYWPEAPDDKDNNVFFGGQSAVDAIIARPRLNRDRP